MLQTYLKQLESECGAKTIDLDKLKRMLRYTSGIFIVDNFAIKVIYWAHKDQIELRIKDNLVESYKNSGKLAKLQQICQQLHDAIREYVSE